MTAGLLPPLDHPQGKTLARCVSVLGAKTGARIVEIDDWNSIAAETTAAFSPLLPHALAARNLLLAQDAGATTVITPIPRIARALAVTRALLADERRAAEIGRIVGREIAIEIDVAGCGEFFLNFVETARYDDKIAARRFFFDDDVLAKRAAAAGLCATYLPLPPVAGLEVFRFARRDIAERLTRTVWEIVTRAGAGIFVTSDPDLFECMDALYPEIRRRYDREFNTAVMHGLEFVALLAGVSVAELPLDLHVSCVPSFDTEDK